MPSKTALEKNMHVRILRLVLQTPFLHTQTHTHIGTAFCSISHSQIRTVEIARLFFRGKRDIFFLLFFSPVTTAMRHNRIAGNFLSLSLSPSEKQKRVMIIRNNRGGKRGETSV